jgi:hypothetical protein
LPLYHRLADITGHNYNRKTSDIVSLVFQE